MALRDYLATEIALDHADGLLSRRAALHRLGLLGLSTAAASTLLVACSSAAPPAAAPSAAPAPPASSAAATPTAAPDYDVPAARARSADVTFPGGTGTMSGAYAAADSPRGAVLVVHENRGLTDHIRAVAGPSELKAAVPFYGPAPDAPRFAGSQAAVLGVFAEKDARVNAGRDKLEAALTAAGLTHELVTVPRVDHAFFNDTGARYNEAAASQVYRQVLDWFGAHLT